MTAQAINFLKILHLLTGAGGREDIAAFLHDNARTFAVVFQFVYLLRDGIQCDVHTGSPDELTIGFNRSGHGYDQFARAGSYISIGKEHLVLGLGILIPGTLTRVAFPGLIAGVIPQPPAVFRRTRHFQNFLIRHGGAQSGLAMHNVKIAIQTGHVVGRCLAKGPFLPQPAIQHHSLAGNRRPQLTVHALIQVTAGHNVADDGHNGH